MEATNDKQKPLTLEHEDYFLDTVLFQAGTSNSEFSTSDVTHFTHLELFSRFGYRFQADWDGMMKQTGDTPSAEALEALLRKTFGDSKLELVYVAAARNPEGLPPILVKFAVIK